MTSLEPRSPVNGWGSGGGGAPAAHAPTHDPGGTDPLTGYLATAQRGAANGVGSLTSAARQASAEIPIVKHQIRLGSVTSTVTSDAGSGAGNLVNINTNGNITVGAPTNPVDWQEFEHHFVAVGADRTVTFTGGYVLGGAPTLGPYLVPRGKVLIARSVYIGNRATAADAAAPAWALVSAAVTDSAGEFRAQRLTTTSDALTDLDSTLIVNSASNLTVTLPTAVGRAGRRYTLVKTGTGVLTIDPAGSETIAGALTETISTQFGFREIESDGTNWVIVGGKVDPIIAALADTAAAGTLTINAAAASVYRGRLTGSTATLAAPTNPVDGDVVNVELYPTVACSLTIASAVVLTGGITSPISIPAGKLWSAALRYRAATNPATSAAAWRLLASSVDN